MLIDDVFWIQVKSMWSKKCEVKLAQKDKIRPDSPSDELIDQMDDYEL